MNEMHKLQRTDLKYIFVSVVQLLTMSKLSHAVYVSLGVWKLRVVEIQMKSCPKFERYYIDSLWNKINKKYFVEMFRNDRISSNRVQEKILYNLSIDISRYWMPINVSTSNVKGFYCYARTVMQRQIAKYNGKSKFVNCHDFLWTEYVSNGSQALQLASKILLAR